MASLLQAILLLMTYCLDNVLSSAVINIRLQSYKVDGRDFNGKSCDYWVSWWPACDPKFKFCIDNVDGDSNSFDSCSIANYIQTEHYDGNDVTFPANGALPGNKVSNPMIVKVPIYNGFKFKARIMDDDTPYDDLIDTIIYTHTDRPGKRARNADWEFVTATGNRYNNPSSLSFELKVYCEENYYGPKCDTYCVAADNHKGHYTCDPETGDPICRPGWENEDEKCTIKKDNCNNDPCKNGGKCIDLYKGYICTCPTGFTGKNCGIVEKAAVVGGAGGGGAGGGGDEDEDQDMDSRGNQDRDSDGGDNFRGRYKDEQEEEEEEEERRQTGPECYQGRCRNGGTCVNGIDGPTCICRSGYEGTYCDRIDPDINRVEPRVIERIIERQPQVESKPEAPRRPTVTCYNGGRPEMHHGEVRCRCPERFVGLACDVDRCSLCSCNNYSFCPNYRQPERREPERREPERRQPSAGSYSQESREQIHQARKSIHNQRKSGYNYQ